MKKKMVIALALVLLAVAGCGKNAGNGGNGGTQPGTPSTPSNPGGGGTQPGTPSTPSNPGGGGTQPGTPGNQKSTYEKKDLGPFKAGDVAKIGPLEVTVTSFTKKKAPGLPANTNLAYVLVLVTVKNTGVTDYPINLTEHYKFFNSEDKSFVMQSAATNTETKRLTGTVKAGDTAEGYIGYFPKLVAGAKNKFVFTHPDWGTATWEYAS